MYNLIEDPQYAELYDWLQNTMGMQMPMKRTIKPPMWQLEASETISKGLNATNDTNFNRLAFGVKRPFNFNTAAFLVVKFLRG